MEALAYKNAVISILNFYLIIEPNEKTSLMSAREIIRNGSFFRKIGLLHLLIAFAYMTLTVIACFFGYDSEGLNWAVMMCAVVNFAIPLILSKLIDESTIDEIAKDVSDLDFEQSNYGIDFELKEILTNTEIYFYLLLTFIVIGNTRMISEQAVVLSLGKEEAGLELLRFN